MLLWGTVPQGNMDKHIFTVSLILCHHHYILHIDTLWSGGDPVSTIDHVIYLSCKLYILGFLL